MIDNSYTKDWRFKLGFSNKQLLKLFFKASDDEMKSSIDYYYIEKLNSRIFDIVEKISSSIHNKIPIKNINEIIKNINSTYNRILPKINTMNNNGRRVEKVYFSWMIGKSFLELFMPSLEYIFDCKIKIIGDDMDNNWKRTPKADLELFYNNTIIRLEFQTGFQGINDIKQHKIREARKQFKESNIETWVVHFDFFNGFVAFIDIFNIDENDMNWISRKVMEGQIVWNISQNYFIWRLINQPPKFKEIISMLYG